MQRALWSGAISFGLVHIPVEMFSAEKRSELDLTMLDRRDFAPIGYKKFNKETGQEVAREDIVKGYEYETDQYVVLSDEDLKRANVKATQTIDIVTFVEASEVPLTYYDQPYYLAPGKGGDKVYALLRETLRRAGKIGIAQIVLRTKQHLVALWPMQDAIVLNTLRYSAEIKALDEFKLPDTDLKKAGISEKELTMALSLVEGMSEQWQPTQYHDAYRDDVLALIDRKVSEHQTKTITMPDKQGAAGATGSAKIVDLMALLKESLAGKAGKGGHAKTKPDADDQETTSPAGKKSNVTRLPSPKKPSAARAKAEPAVKGAKATSASKPSKDVKTGKTAASPRRARA